MLSFSPDHGYKSLNTCLTGSNGLIVKYNYYYCSRSHSLFLTNDLKEYSNNGNILSTNSINNSSLALIAIIDCLMIHPFGENDIVLNFSNEWKWSRACYKILPQGKM